MDERKYRALQPTPSYLLNQRSNYYATMSGKPSHIEKQKRKRQKKAPGAPKRGKSPYICFSMANREAIKQSLPKDTKVTEIVRALARRWGELNEEERAPWIEIAKKDKKRYEDEMANYDGPLRVSCKVRDENSDEPVGPKSAFDLFGQKMRAYWKGTNPLLSTVEIAVRLTETWDCATKRQKQPYFDLEKKDLLRYENEKQQHTFKKQNDMYGASSEFSGGNYNVHARHPSIIQNSQHSNIARDNSMNSMRWSGGLVPPPNNDLEYSNNHNEYYPYSYATASTLPNMAGNNFFEGPYADNGSTGHFQQNRITSDQQYSNTLFSVNEQQ